MPSRDETLAIYRPIRASIEAVLAEALKHCKVPDLRRAARQLDLIDQDQLAYGQAGAMLHDVALFEPNSRGRRAFDTFLAKGIRALDPADRDVAHRLATAFFSIFRIAGRNPAGGVWLDDRLASGRRIWLMDEGLEATGPEGLVIALRVADVGPFHAGFGLVVQPDAEAIAFCESAVSRGEPPPVRHSLAAALYGDAIAEASALPIWTNEMADFLDALSRGPRRLGGRDG